MPAPDDTLAAIDAALEWSPDAMRWAPDLPERGMGAPTPEQVERLVRQIAQVQIAQAQRIAEVLREQLVPLARAAAEKIAKLGAALELVPPADPDPYARALAARRNRNTGPARGYQADRREVRR